MFKSSKVERMKWSGRGEREVGLTLAQITSGFVNLESWAFDRRIDVWRTASDDGVLHLYVLNRKGQVSVGSRLALGFSGYLVGTETRPGGKQGGGGSDARETRL